MLWIAFFNIIWELRPAFSRQQTFFWAIIAIMSFSIRQDFCGVTSLVRSSWISEKYYTRLTGFFHSHAIDLNKLTVLWFSLCLKIFSKHLVTFNGRYILLADGLKIPKEGRKMPGIKCHHQQSQNNSKAEYIMGHSFQAISLLAKASDSFFAVPLASRLHEGFKLSNRDHRTLFDKLLSLLDDVVTEGKYYLLADAYYSCKTMIKGLLEKGNHLITKMKFNAVAYEKVESTKKQRGRPKLYGKKVILKKHFQEADGFKRFRSPLYDDKNIFIEIKVLDLVLKGVSRVVRYVLVKHPKRGNVILMSTNTNLDGISIVELYGRRFKIEVGFKSAIHTLGVYSYRFWMGKMKKTRKGDGTQHLHKKDEAYRKAYLTKIRAYHIHVQLGLIAQGILQYLSINNNLEVWKCFGGWLRTIRSGVPASERVVSLALKNTAIEFLMSKGIPSAFKKFLEIRIDIGNVYEHRLSG